MEDGNGIMIKSKELIYLLFSLIFVFYQLFSLKELNMEFIRYLPLLLLVIVGLFFIMKKRTMVFQRSMLLIIIPVVSNFLILPFFSFNIGNYNLLIEVTNIILQIIFLLGILIVISYVNTLEDFYKLVRYSLISHSVILTICIFLNFNQVLNPDNYIWLSSIRLDRADYGFYHPNTAGIFLITEILLLTIYYIYTNKIRIIFFALFYLLCLIPTGNRTAILCLILFFSVFFFIKLVNLFDKKVRVFYLLIILSSMFLILVYFDWDYIWENSSDRDYYFVKNFEYMMDQNLFWFGVGPINQTSLHVVNSDILITDNWYLANFILYGIFGTAVFIVTLFLIIKRYFNYTFFNKGNNLLIWGLSFTIIFIFYNLFETILYIPGVTISMVFWVYVLSILNLNMKK
ncbi:O-antigen ligase family protein [Planococcus sp. CAU13]|uniref:O-antigen ligase family protein n=1 Tax=Planococcus sp. CAU13 TaxID=1541197 RepID=UPI00052FF9A7|nr:hypothetical protein [Planococcus sp. CAU13]